MDPGTAAILTLSAITGVSGYGAYKLNARRGESIAEEVQLALGDTRATIKAAEEAKLKAIDALNKQNKEVERLTNEINELKKVKQQLESEKSVMSKNLEDAGELEKTFRELPTEVFKQAINDFKSKPEIVKLGHPEFFEPLLSRFSVTRGSARTLYAKFKKVVVDIMPKSEFDALLLDALKNGTTSLEQRQKKEATEAQEAKDKIANEKAEAKAKVEEKAKAERDVAAAKAFALRQEALDKAVEESNIREAEAKKKTEAAALAALRSKIDKNKADEEALKIKEAKDKLTLQDIVNQAFEAAKVGPLQSNTLYQKIKTPFLSGVDSVARGVQKAVDVTKQAAVETGKVIRRPLTQYEERQKRYKEALEQQGGAGDTFDTDVYYRLFHPKDEDIPNKVLADLFRKTSTDAVLAKNMLPIFDAFMFWRSTVLKYPLLYKVELVASAEKLFKLVEPIQVNAVFQNKDLKKAMEAVKRVGTKEVTTRMNPMTGRTAGGMRKKKLRTRRGVKQNDRRTRRGQNRPNRTDTYSSRRSEVDASRDESGL
jgi:hypothetical protein